MLQGNAWTAAAAFGLGAAITGNVVIASILLAFAVLAMLES